MNKRAIVYVLGAVLLIGAALMLLPLLVALIYHEVSGWYFLWVMLGAAVLGALALRLGGGKRAVMYAKEGDRKSTRLNSSHSGESRMPSSA